MKTFNTAGTCRPNEHYMVDITERLEIIRKMIAKGDYFCINRGRQYGKTTTLEAISTQFTDEYCIFPISFEIVSDTTFADEEKLYSTFVWLLAQQFKWMPLKGLDEEVGNEIKSFSDTHKEKCSETELSEFISTICHRNKKPIVLLIDEVDQAGNNVSFLKFLGLLRGMYLRRNVIPTFQSIILAGVYDIKNLKLKMRPEDQHQYNSPWNIAVPFDVDMSLSAEGIANMLAEYKTDHRLDFDEKAIAQMIRDYTAGYPFLVSRICQIIDAEQWTWDKDGVLKTVNKILTEGSTLFDDIAKKLDEFPELERTIRGVLFNGYRYSFNYYDKATNLALMFNFVKQQDGAFAVACRMFEIWFYEYFISQDKNSADFIQGMNDKNQFIHDGILDIPRIFERFVVHMNQTYKMDHDNEFIENDARKVFLTYLRPVINGVGSYHIEEQTRDHDRMDVVIDYLGMQYVVELKIWRGNAYNERGEEQLCRYLEYFDLQEGYLISFCFNKTKQSGLQPPVVLNGRTLIEAVV
ncbi:MAG: AAA-like domain-containing protein [Bacteroidales bacterium]|nr:AAA-like domain-containing protein [Candidatus Liminaster caballi]